MTKFSFDNDRLAYTDSRVRLQEAGEVVTRGRQLVKCFGQHGIGDHPETDKALEGFIEAIYGAGFVMSDFDGPLFARGPMNLILDPALAVQVVQASNTLTLRMISHTLARGHRGTYEFSGYPYFDQAFESGALGAWVARLDQLCSEASGAGLEHLD